MDGWGALKNVNLGTMEKMFVRLHYNEDDLSGRPLTGDFLEGQKILYLIRSDLFQLYKVGVVLSLQVSSCYNLIR